MPLRFLLRPAVLASIALHGALAAVAWTAGPLVRPDAEARVCGMIADETQGPEDVVEIPEAPEVPRLVPETVAEAPAPTDVLPSAEIVPELLEPPAEPAASVPALLDRAPVGVRTAPDTASETQEERPPVTASTPTSETGVVPLRAEPRPAAVSQLASQKGTRATTDAVGEPTNRPPAYPFEALRRGYEGTTYVQVEILENGRVGNAFVETSSGFDVLDAAALDAIRGWRYRPRVVDGVAARDLLRVPFRFRLRAT